MERKVDQFGYVINMPVVGGVSEEDAVVVEDSGEGKPPARSLYVLFWLDPWKEILTGTRLLLYHGMCCTIAVTSNTGNNIQYVS